MSLGKSNIGGGSGREILMTEIITSTKTFTPLVSKLNVLVYGGGGGGGGIGAGGGGNAHYLSTTNTGGSGICIIQYYIYDKES